MAFKWAWDPSRDGRIANGMSCYCYLLAYSHSVTIVLKITILCPPRFSGHRGVIALANICMQTIVMIILTLFKNKYNMRDFSPERSKWLLRLILSSTSSSWNWLQKTAHPVEYRHPVVAAFRTFPLQIVYHPNDDLLIIPISWLWILSYRKAMSLKTRDIDRLDVHSDAIKLCWCDMSVHPSHLYSIQLQNPKMQ